MDSTDELTRQIRRGTYDASLGLIADAIEFRKRVLRRDKARQVSSKLALGDAVMVGDIRPKYLIGTVANVIKVGVKTVTVQMPTGKGRYSGAAVRIPADLLTKVGTAKTPESPKVPTVEADDDTEKTVEADETEKTIRTAFKQGLSK